MVFFPVPGANFDLASFSFQGPICGLAKQNVPAAKNSARVSSDVFVFIWPFQPGIGFAVKYFFKRRTNWGILTAGYTDFTDVKITAPRQSDLACKNESCPDLESEKSVFIPERM